MIVSVLTPWRSKPASLPSNAMVSRSAPSQVGTGSVVDGADVVCASVGRDVDGVREQKSKAVL